MSYEYAMSRVRDAIEKSDGNHLKAQRLITTWLENDQMLLVGLAGPHLPGIISYAMLQAAQTPKAKMPKKVELDESKAPPPGKASQKHIDAINTLVGKNKKKD
jgi:hypothetical protein